MSQKADVEKLVYEKSYKPKCGNPGSHNREQMSIDGFGGRHEISLVEGKPESLVSRVMAST
jgi:hypothetical protein